MFTFLGNSSPASQSFGYVLADKIKMDELKMYDKFRYETKNIPENNITGTFCIDLRADNLDKKSEINLLSENQTEKSGILIVNGQKKKASLDTKNNKINISTLSKPWHWHWYNWLGIGIDKVEKQSLEEKVNSPI
jgi:hypothetical protein